MTDPDGAFWTTILDSGTAVTLVAVATAIVGLVTGLISNRRAASKGQATKKVPSQLDAKLDRILTLSHELTALNGEVQSAFALQLAATEKAQREAKEAAAIAALNAEQREAAEAMVASQIDLALQRSGRKDRRFQIAVAIVSFLLGIATTFGIQLLTAPPTPVDPTEPTNSLPAFEQTVQITLNVL